MQSRSKPNYEAAVKKIRSARGTNIILCGVVMVAALGMGIWSAFTDYQTFGVLAALIVVGATLGLLLKNMNEQAAVGAIVKHSVYAAPVSQQELVVIRKHQNRRGQRFYFTAMLWLLAPVTVTMLVFYFITKSNVYLLFLAGFALACLLVVGCSCLYLNARFSLKKNAICLVSGRGIILAGEVLPFSAKKGEALLLFRFSDFYSLRFAKSAVFGIKYESDVIFPVDGALRAGLEGTCDEELTAALYLDGVFATDDAFYESRDYLADTGVEGIADSELSDDIVAGAGLPNVTTEVAPLSGDDDDSFRIGQD